MDKTAIVNSLISAGGYAEADREWLMSLSDDALKRVKPVTANATPAAPAPLTREAIAAAMGQDWMQVYNFGQQTLNARKVQMVNSLKALGPRCPYNEAALNAMPPDHLEALCVLAGVGPTGAPAGGAAPVGNSNSPFAPTFVPGMWGAAPAAPQGNYLLNSGAYLQPPAGGSEGRAEKDDDGLDEPVLNFGKKSA